MAFLKYRGSAIPTVAWTVDSADGASLTNTDIDTNFYTLNAQKLDVAGGSITGNLVIGGALTVNGSITTINSTTISVDDKNIELGSVVAPTDLTADGGGITLKGATDKTFNWLDATDAWTSSEHIAVAAGKTLRVSGSTSGTVTITATAIAGTPTITLPATTGTLALTSQLPTVNDAALTLSIGTAGATNTTVTVGTGTGFSANDSSPITYDIKVGPALTNLASTMTTGGAGFIKRGATADTYTIDTNLYALSSHGHYIGTTAVQSSSNNQAIAGILSTTYAGSISGTTLLIPAAAAGATTITMPATTGTMALTSNIGDGVISVTAGAGLTGGGQAGTANQTGASSVTLSHADTSTVLDLTAASNTFIAGETFDTYGHVISRTTGTVDFTVADNYAFRNVNISEDGAPYVNWGLINTNTSQVADSSNDTLTFIAGGGIALYSDTSATIDAIRINHADTSSAANLLASARTYVSTLTFDTYGHVTGYSTGTETVVDTNTWDANALNVAGYVAAPTVVNANQIWSCDALGNPAWRTPGASGATLSSVADSTTYYIGLSAAATGAWTDARVDTTDLYYTTSNNTLHVNTVSTASDSRLKYNVEVITNATNAIKEMRGVGFNWKQNGIKSYGVIAQELETILPELVDTVDNKKSVNYLAIIGFLIESVKEMSQRIEVLENK